MERVFPGALIVASKYLNDSTMKNVHWTMCNDIFGKADIGVIEREVLEVLDFELRVREHDILRKLAADFENSIPHPLRSSSAHRTHHLWHRIPLRKI
ncbi:hypothetical protein B0H13DRAFT_1672721 [Mycena leptocephala]|nr:hypothetical protein B0H13DRAFT_1672721 [Mycena leptocephala]